MKLEHNKSAEEVAAAQGKHQDNKTADTPASVPTSETNGDKSGEPADAKVPEKEAPSSNGTAPESSSAPKKLSYAQMAYANGTKSSE